MNRLFLLLLSGILIFSCQRGEEDPFISFKSRKMRLTGDWKVDWAEMVEGDTSWLIANGEMVRSVNGDESPAIPYTQNISFQNDGVYRINVTIEFPDDYDFIGQLGYTFSQEQTGIWQFSGGNGEVKSKSLLVFLPDKIQESTFIGGALDVTAYEGQNEANVYDIVKLTSSETKLRYDKLIKDDLGSYRSSASYTLVKR